MRMFIFIYIALCLHMLTDTIFFLPAKTGCFDGFRASDGHSVKGNMVANNTKETNMQLCHIRCHMLLQYHTLY